MLPLSGKNFKNRVKEKNADYCFTDIFVGSIFSGISAFISTLLEPSVWSLIVGWISILFVFISLIGNSITNWPLFVTNDTSLSLLTYLFNI